MSRKSGFYLELPKWISRKRLVCDGLGKERTLVSLPLSPVRVTCLPMLSTTPKNTHIPINGV